MDSAAPMLGARRILYLYQTDAQAETESPFVLVQNFFEELKARVPN